MNTIKAKIIHGICYTELVYNRINKKLNCTYSKPETEAMILNIIKETPESGFQKIGKNFYVTNAQNNIRITINANNYRVITVDITNKKLKP